MSSLKEVIAALRREIDGALEEETERTEGIRLKAGRIVLSLGVSMKERPTKEGSMELSFDLLEAGAASEKTGHHTLTLEFQLTASSTSNEGAPSPFSGQPLQTRPTPAAPLSRTEAERLADALAGLFGAPGFDSSARATVFREVFAELSEARARTLIESFSGKTMPDEDVSLRNARHRISGVLRSGPSRSTQRGAELLAEVFGGHALKPVLRLIQEKWKSQQDWLDEPAAVSPPKP